MPNPICSSYGLAEYDEDVFAKLTKQLPRDIRVAPVDEIYTRIAQCLEQVNADPVLFHWRWRSQTPLKDAQAI